MDFNDTKKILDNISPSFCAAKWLNTSIWLNNGKTSSCHLPPAHKIDLNKNDPRSLHNTTVKEEERNQMLKGERPEGCSLCWSIEDNSLDYSERIFKSHIYSQKEIEDLKNETDPIPKTVEIVFNRSCNSACSYCNPEFSTLWAKEIRDIGPYSINQKYGSQYQKTFDTEFHKDDNEYIEAFFNWMSELNKNVSEFRVSGGEPLIQPQFWKFLDQVDKQIPIAVNTNLWVNNKIIEKLNSVPKDIRIYTSMETIDDKCFFIRNPIEYNVWENNLLKLKQEKINIMLTISNLSIIGLEDFLKRLQELKRVKNIVISINVVRFPHFFNVNVLSNEIKKMIKESISEFLVNCDLKLWTSFELAHIKRLINYINTKKIPDNIDLEFKAFVSQYEKRRKLDFIKTFPELEDWYNNIGF